jgi:hypothetical protein
MHSVDRGKANLPLRRRRSSLSSFESSSSTIRPWDVQGEITPKPSKVQLARQGVEEACQDQLVSRPKHVTRHQAHSSMGAVEWQRTVERDQEPTAKKQKRATQGLSGYDGFDMASRCGTEPPSPLAGRQVAAARGRRRTRGVPHENKDRDERDVRGGWWDGFGGWLGRERSA